jgi:hypothetical protein
MLTYALGVGLGSMLMIGAAADQVRTVSVAAGHVTQYCAPPQDYPDAHRFYCRKRDDWPCPTGAAAFSCFMQDRGNDALMEPIERRGRQVQPNRCWVPLLAFS